MSGVNLLQDFVSPTTLPTTMAPIFKEEDNVFVQTQRLEEISEEENYGTASASPDQEFQLEAGTVNLTVQPFALEFCNARERKLSLKQREISALMCQLPEAQKKFQALCEAASEAAKEGVRLLDGVKWSQPISSSKNYKINLELAVYNKTAYLALVSFFRPDKMRALAEMEDVQPGSEKKITQFFEQLRKKTEGESADDGWARTRSAFRIRIHEIDKLMDFVIANMI